MLCAKLKSSGLDLWLWYDECFVQVQRNVKEEIEEKPAVPQVTKRGGVQVVCGIPKKQE